MRVIKEHKCDICGRLSKNKLKIDHYVLCKKHYNQYKKHHKFADNNPRNHTDLNEIRVINHIAYMDLYDANFNVIATTMFDVEDIKKVKYSKWKLTSGTYVVNKPKFGPSNKVFSKIVLNTDKYILYKNGNTLDNRKSNLMIVNSLDKDISSNGVFLLNNKKYYATIKHNNISYNLGIYLYKEEAIYARWYGEYLIFTMCRNKEPDLNDKRKEQIKEYINKKVQRL